ncbi:MarR family winged helix-turn-helix transcriptional regulator [Kribbella sp.]|uniref:MarR family winged helix-turn-helix transcriptional regulator n=1 Tax=Kribbella sp. TaxID=1871183 RepID=UPI002D50B26A|nr:MarR family transcriptional regulator [Kribbella sp.]HZX05220.1 MarR family transcriptional regulator [Kribbella sp.]
MKATTPLRDSLAFRLAVVGASLENEFARYLKESGLTPKHVGVLAVVDAGLARMQDDVATLMGVTPGMVVRLVDHLEARELLRRERDPQNRRRYVLVLTAAGKKALEAAEKFTQALDERLTAPGGAVSRSRLDEALTVLMRDLNGQA